MYGAACVHAFRLRREGRSQATRRAKHAESLGRVRTLSFSLRALFFAVILIEGYVVLATELIAIRQLVPFVGNATDTIAIIIAAVLMPLSFGYYAGGHYKPKKDRKGRVITIREKLIRNVINATLLLSVGLSYFFLEIFFFALSALEITDRIAQTSIYSLMFLAFPVFLLGQTVPLVSNYFARSRVSLATGHMLFFSTVGSFFGSVISTLVLMATIGVHYTVAVNIGLLVLLVFLLSKRRVGINNLIMLAFFSLALALNSGGMMEQLQIVKDNQYSTTAVLDVEDEEDSRLLIINRSVSSKYTPDEENNLEYLKYINTRFIDPIANREGEAKSILIIGAGGFTIGLNDLTNRYVYVDIDSSLKEISEEYFLKRPLAENKIFVPEPARAFLARDKEQYDLIVLDAFTNKQTIPFQLITREFFRDVKAALKPGGIVLFNVITHPAFGERFAIKLDNTLRTAFPMLNRHVVREYNAWHTEEEFNVIYSYHHIPYTPGIYTDDKNTYFYDR